MCLQSIPDEKRGGISVFDAITPDGHPKMGCSISVAGEAGGWDGCFALTHAGVTHHGFLSNSHVVRPASNASKNSKDARNSKCKDSYKPPNNDPECQEHYSYSGIGYSDAQQWRIRY